MLVNPTSFLRAARLQGRAVAAFNIHNLETLQAAVAAARKIRCPLLLQATPGTVEFAGADYLVAMARTAAKDGQPLSLHLDHATDLTLIADCLRAGFSSVMYDGSRLPLDQNIINTLAVLDMARSYGAAVEAELGQLGGREEEIEGDSVLTDPKEAQEFLKRTGVDMLAVAIGSAHGLYKGEPNLDFERLAKIAALVSVPLVLHGGSGLAAAQVRSAIALGVAKVNIATELKIPFTEALMEQMSVLSGQGKDKYDPRVYMGAARAAVTNVAVGKADLCWNTDKERLDDYPQ